MCTKERHLCLFHSRGFPHFLLQFWKLKKFLSYIVPLSQPLHKFRVNHGHLCCFHDSFMFVMFFCKWWTQIPIQSLLSVYWSLFPVWAGTFLLYALLWSAWTQIKNQNLALSPDLSFPYVHISYQTPPEARLKPLACIASTTDSSRSFYYYYCYVTLKNNTSI